MPVKAVIVIAAVLLSSCAHVRPVQLTPPAPIPPGLIWGYGVEKVRDNPERGRRSAYLKAIDDLLTRGPVLVSKTVQDHTIVLDMKSSNRTMESTFRLQASRVLQPSFMDTGFEDGFVWVLVGTTEADLDRGWQQFVEWRNLKIQQAQKLFQDANGREKLALLKAAVALLEEAGARDDPSLLYYQVKTALDSELARLDHLEKFEKELPALIDSGQLAAAESALEQALLAGLDQSLYQRVKMKIMDHREQAAQLIAAGDDLFRNEQYMEALDRYQHAQRLDRDNPQLPTKLAMAERYDRTARSEKKRATVGVISVSATKVMSEFFAYKREQERRKRAEAEKAATRAEENRNGPPPPNPDPGPREQP